MGTKTIIEIFPQNGAEKDGRNNPIIKTRCVGFLTGFSEGFFVATKSVLSVAIIAGFYKGILLRQKILLSEQSILVLKHKMEG